MSGLREYSALTTKIRAMQSRLLDDSIYREILSAPDVSSAAALLRRLPSYQDVLADESYNIHRVSTEPDIARSTYRDFESIYHFCNQQQRRFLRTYARRFECRILKQIMESLISQGKVDQRFLLSKDFFDHYTDLNLEALCAATSLSELTDALTGTPYRQILEPLFQNTEANLFDYHVAVDQYFFSSMWKKNGGLTDKKNINIIREAFGTRFDMLNLMWISRAHRNFHMSRTDIYGMLIPFSYRLKSEEIGRLLDAETDSQYREVLASTWYGRKYGEYMVPEKLGFEYNYLLHRTLDRLARQNPYSIATPYRYIYLKEHEVTRLTVALECRHYNTPVEEAMKMLNGI